MKTRKESDQRTKASLSPDRSSSTDPEEHLLRTDKLHHKIGHRELSQRVSLGRILLAERKRTGKQRKNSCHSWNDRKDSRQGERAAFANIRCAAVRKEATASGRFNLRQWPRDFEKELITRLGSSANRNFVVFPARRRFRRAEVREL